MARDVCGAPALFAAVEAAEVAPDLRWELSATVQDAVRQVSRWYLRRDGATGDELRVMVAQHRAAAQAIIDRAVQHPDDEQVHAWRVAGAPEPLLVAVSSCRLLPLAPYLADASTRHSCGLPELVDAVDALREQIGSTRLRRSWLGSPPARR